MSSSQKSDLEDINPAFSAKVILTVYKVIFVILFLVFTVYPLIATAGRPAGIFTGIMIVLPSTLVLVLIYNHLTRVAIASLMTWHFARETALTNREILACLRGGTTPSAPHITPKAQPIPPNPNAPLSTPKVRVPKMRISKPKPTPPESPDEPERNIVVMCPVCGARFRAKASAIGKNIPCPKCGEAFTVEEA